MGNEEPSGQQAVEHCPRCGSVVENAAGIGPFCPNAKCDVADNLLCVPTFSTTAPTAPSTAAGEPALVCGCGWEGSYADLNETAEGMTCPKCRLSRNMDCAATPPAQVMKQPGPELDRAMDAALLRSAKIIDDVPWQEQAAQQCEEWALLLSEKSAHAATAFERIQLAADAVKLRDHARAFRALARSEKGEGK